MACVDVLLRAGPADGRVVDGGGETVTYAACLYERTGKRQAYRGRDQPVYEHRPDCCEGNQRGAEDRCE